jgi:hypothetical protein
MLMLSIGMLKCYINTTITILDIIRLITFYFKHDSQATGFCLRLQVIQSRLGTIDRASVWLWTQGLAVPETGTSSVDFTQLIIYHLKMEAMQSPKRCV